MTSMKLNDEEQDMLAGKSGVVVQQALLHTAKGGVASAWTLHEMAERGVIPLALVFNSANPILAQGATLADLPMLAGFDEDITAAIANDSEVEVNPARRILTLIQ